VVSVIGESLRVRDDEEEEIQDDGVLAAAAEISVAEEALVDPTELFGDAAPLLWAEKEFADHKAPGVGW
jgi:hypothetical protein